jgi:hypothetical protein
LHKFGEVTLGELNIKWPRDENGPLAFFNGDVQMPWSENGPAEIIVNGKDRAPLADIAIPENVKNFESIRLRFSVTIKFVQIKLLFSYYDKSIIDFLRKFQQNSLLTNLNLSFYGCSDWNIVFKFLPLITSTNSIAVMNNSSDLLGELQNEYAEHAIPMLTSARILIAVLVFTKKNKKLYIFLILVIILMTVGFPTGFTFQGKMESHGFCFFMVTIGVNVYLLCLNSSNTSKRSVK